MGKHSRCGVFEAFGKSSVYAKIKVVPELNPEGSHKILLLDQIVYPGSTRYSKCFLISTLIVSFNICFHFSFSVHLSDQNYECLS